MAHIKTFCRIKPTSRRIYDDYDTTNTTVYIRVPEHLNPVSWGLNVRAKRSVVNHEFKFNGVFNEQASQTDVFDTSARSIVEGFLSGYNGTIFAYGQTGTGKTYTVEGGAKSYKDRGISPRSLSLIYKCLASRSDEDVEIHVSYMEIYQEIGYDLLNMAARTTSMVTPFPKVAVVEGAKGTCIIRNLSSHLAATEDVAQHLLLQGQANRKVAETPMNQRSSRSHAVFTVYLTAKKQDSDVVVKSKLHLVDLAGSERVSKTGTVGLQLSEAKFINLSLHHLEGVIIALQKEVTGSATRQLDRRPASANTALDYKLYNSMFRAKVQKHRYNPYKEDMTRWVNSMRPSYAANKFVPYRNSLLTMVLRDSLGGNCQTAMIATISLEIENLSESISTCRFSQRVACVTNTLRKNEEIDDKSMIRRLRKKIAELETEVTSLRTSPDRDNDSVDYTTTLDGKLLTDEEKIRCTEIVQGYVGGKVKDPILAGVTNVVRFRECLRLLKVMVNHHLINQEDSSSDMLAIEMPRPETAPPSPHVAWGDNNSLQVPAVKSDHSSQSFPSSVSVESEVNLADYNIVSSSATSIPNSDSNIGSMKDLQNDRDTPVVQEKNSSDDTKQNSKQKTTEKSVKGGGSNNSRSNSPACNGPWMSGPGAGGKMRAKSPMRPGSGGYPGGWHPLRPESGGPVGSQKGGEPCRAGSASGPGRTQPHVFAKPAMYKSPFEQKREQEIKKLDKKVEQAKVEIAEQKEELASMQSGVKVQQLEVLRNEVKGKLEKTNVQLSEQQAYLLRLKKSHSEQELLEQEKLVEKQLRKRQHKMEKRLDLIDNQLISVKNSDENNPSAENANSHEREPTQKPAGKQLERKYSQFVKRDGKVDGRKVMMLLQNQDKKQGKVQTQLERDKLLTLSSQVEVKEAATRQKLQEFREKLRNRNQHNGTTNQKAQNQSALTNQNEEFQNSNDSFLLNSQNAFDPDSTKVSEIDSVSIGDRLSMLSSELGSVSLDSFVSDDFNGNENGSAERMPNSNGGSNRMSNSTFKVDQPQKHGSNNSNLKNNSEPGFKSNSYSKTTSSNGDASNNGQESRPSTGSSSLLLSKWAANNKSYFSTSAGGDLEWARLQSTMIESRPNTGGGDRKPKKWDDAYSRNSRLATPFDLGPASDLSNIHSNKIQFTNSSTVQELGAGYEDFPFMANTPRDRSANEDMESISGESDSTLKGNSSPRNNPKLVDEKSPGNYPDFGGKSEKKSSDVFKPGYFSNSVTSRKEEVVNNNNGFSDGYFSKSNPVNSGAKDMNRNNHDRNSNTNTFSNTAYSQKDNMNYKSHYTNSNIETNNSQFKETNGESVQRKDRGSSPVTIKYGNKNDNRNSSDNRNNGGNRNNDGKGLPVTIKYGDDSVNNKNRGAKGSVTDNAGNITDYEKSQRLRPPQPSIPSDGGVTRGMHNVQNTSPAETFNKFSKQQVSKQQRPPTQPSPQPHSDFDEALSEMLGMGKDYGAVTLGHAQYDKYARNQGKAGRAAVTGGGGRGNVAQGGRMTSSAAAAKSIYGGSGVSASTSSSQMWGPEAKNISISDRLAQYLDMDSFCDSKRLPKGKVSFEDTDIRPYKKPSIADDAKTTGPSGEWKKKQMIGKSRPEIDVDSYKQKIKAMGEEEGEETYMSTAREQKNRIQKIRQARSAAETIQKAWRRYKGK